ncbi:MAG: magnesium transporter MgtE N-terminal domain-containing protein [Ectothiorhodospira sp.]
MNRITHNLTRIFGLLRRSPVGATDPARSPRVAGLEPQAEEVTRAWRRGAFGTARLAFLGLAEASQIRVLQSMEPDELRRLGSGLPAATVIRLCERLPQERRRPLLQALPRQRRRARDRLTERRPSRV